jgi:hypothetical protein
MPTYIIHRRRGSSFQITACGYSEDKRAKRIYFHKRADRADRDSFCLLSEIAAIDVQDELGKIEHIDIHSDWAEIVNKFTSELDPDNI